MMTQNVWTWSGVNGEPAHSNSTGFKFVTNRCSCHFYCIGGGVCPVTVVSVGGSTQWDLKEWERALQIEVHGDDFTAQDIRLSGFYAICGEKSRISF